MNLGATRTPRILLQWHGFKTIVSPRIFHRTSQLAYGENSSRLYITVASSYYPQSSKRPGILNYSSTRTIRTSSWTRTGSDLNDAFSEDNKDRFVTQLGRMRTRRSLIASCSEEAGVFVPFCYVNSVPSVLFTLRSNQLNKHRGEVSFPGGKKDPEDKSVVETAVREMEEELGLDKSCVQVWANMPARPDRLGKTAITPVIGFIGEIDINTLELNPEEVESVFTLSLEHICNPVNQGYTKFTSQAVLPLFLNGPHRIWGLTAIILEQVLLTVVPEHYPKQIHRPGNRKLPVYTRKKETNK